jgi:hypothetical protein
LVEHHTGVVDVGEPEITLAIMGFHPMLAVETLSLTLQVLEGKRQLGWGPRVAKEWTYLEEGLHILCS